VCLYSVATPVSGVVSYGNALYFGLWKELLLLAVNVMLCLLVFFIRKNQVNKYVVIFVFNNLNWA
jgi:hypothetical protein